MTKSIKAQLILLPVILMILSLGGINNKLSAQTDTSFFVPTDTTTNFFDTSHTVTPLVNPTRDTGTAPVKKKFTYLFKEDPKDATSWSHFKIDAHAIDDSVFINLQRELLIKPLLESYVVSVNVGDLNAQFVTIGEEGADGSTPFAWDMLSPKTQMDLIKWKGSNKSNLSKTGYNFVSVFTESLRKVKIDEFISPPQKEREIVNSVAYINPYFNFFGGEALGLPIKRGFGFSFQSGTPYSGPLETDMVGANFHLLGASVGVTTRLKELVLKRDAGATKGERESKFGNYNNIYSPKLGLRASYVIPFGNFFEVGYYTVLDSGDYDPPVPIKSTVDTNLMPNQYIAKGGWFNWEFRYPLRVFRSTRSKIYIAQFLGNFNFGFVGREMTLAGSVFDVRINVMMGNATRNTQILAEAYVSSIGEGFSNTAFALGPSVRLTRGPNGSMGVVTVMINARLKIGDYFDEK